MRTHLVVAIILLTAVTPALAADAAGPSPQMWERVRAAGSVAVGLKPTPSPQAPATLSLRECLALASAHNSGFRQSLCSS